MSASKQQTTSRSVCYRQLAKRRPVNTNRSCPPETAGNSSSPTATAEGTSSRGGGCDGEAQIKVPRLKLVDEEEEKAQKAREKRHDVDSLLEINSGDKLTYKVIVKTGDRLGSSSEAEIRLQMFGQRGKSKVIPLTKSTSHQLPFRRANTDVFEIQNYDLGPIKAIKIGHSEKDIGKFMTTVGAHMSIHLF